MVYISNFEALGLNFSPFAPKKKCIPLAVFAGAALAGMASAAMSADSQDSANRTNLKMTQDTNATNREIARETNAMQQAQFDANQTWLREQFYAQRAFDLENRDYNSIQNQVSRLMSAGINPAFGLGQSQGATATSSVSPVGATPQSNFQTGYAEAGHVDPISYDFSGIGEAVGHSVNAYYQNQLINEQTKGQQVSNDIARATAAVQVSKQIQELRNMQQDYRNKLSDRKLTDAQRMKIEADADMLDRQIAVFTNQMDALSKQPKLNNDLMLQQKENIKWSTEILKIEASIKPALAASQIRLNSSQMAVLNEQVGLIANESKESFARGEKVSAEIIGQRIRNSLEKIGLDRELQKWSVRQGSHGTKTLAAFTDYLGEVIFGSLRNLFK